MATNKPTTVERTRKIAAKRQALATHAAQLAGAGSTITVTRAFEEAGSVLVDDMLWTAEALGPRTSYPHPETIAHACGRTQCGALRALVRVLERDDMAHKAQVDAGRVDDSVVRRFKADFGLEAWVRAGYGAVGLGHREIVVYVMGDQPACRLPGTYAGLAVRVEETGPIVVGPAVPERKA